MDWLADVGIAPNCLLRKPESVKRLGYHHLVLDAVVSGFPLYWYLIKTVMMICLEKTGSIRVGLGKKFATEGGESKNRGVKGNAKRNIKVLLFCNNYFFAP